MDPVEVSVALEGEYRFTVDFGLPGVPTLQVDEAPPLGAGAGPNPSRVLAAAVGSCLAASLAFCLRKSRVDVRDVRARVHAPLERNERGRWRMGAMKVALEVDVPAEERARLDRCRELFEDFCIVTQSVRAGVPVEVSVQERSA